jgi:hypothetical protein
MSPLEFCYWLEGYLSASQKSDGTIANKLNQVLGNQKIPAGPAVAAPAYGPIGWQQDKQRNYTYEEALQKSKESIQKDNYWNPSGKYGGSAYGL